MDIIKGKKSYKAFQKLHFSHSSGEKKKKKTVLSLAKIVL